MPPVYRVYGLRLDAGAVLSGLLPDPDDGPVDVRVRLGAWPAALAVGQDAPSFYVSDERTPDGRSALVIRTANAGACYHLAFADGTAFVVDAAGTAVWGRWPSPLTEADALTYLLGPVLGFVLRVRGVTALHGSAVVVDGGAVVLLGASGAGKSTTAAALAMRGHPILADDIVALRDEGGVPTASPAYTHVRLWPESTALLFGAEAVMPPMTPTWDKQRLDLDTPLARMHDAPAPLRAVYVLAPRASADDAPRVEPIASSTALLTLIAHVYGARLPFPTTRRDDVGLLGTVVRRIPVRRVVPHADPARVAALCAAILTDVRRAPPPTRR